MATTPEAIARSATTVGAIRAARWAAPKAATSSATMPVTASTSPAPGVAAWACERLSRSTRSAPGSSCTAWSTSRGMARSRKARGVAAARDATAAATSSAPITVPAAPVQEITRSTSASASGTLARSRVRATSPPRISTSRSARSGVRLAISRSVTPVRTRVAAASELIEPAPTTSARLPAIAPAPAATCSRPKVTSDWPALSMPVSLCARLPTRRACWKSSLRPRAAVCSSCALARASRSWPRIWPSPTTIESRPQATEKRWWTARSS